MSGYKKTIDEEGQKILDSLTDSERLVKESILLRFAFLEPSSIKARFERRNLGDGEWYDGYEDDMSRPFLVVPVYGEHGALTSVVLQINGSPPKGTLFVQVRRIMASNFFIRWVGFEGRGRFRTVYRDFDGEPTKNQDVARAIQTVLKERNVPPSNLPPKVSEIGGGS